MYSILSLIVLNIDRNRKNIPVKVLEISNHFYSMFGGVLDVEPPSDITEKVNCQSQICVDYIS